MMEISKDFNITKKGYENGYNVSYFQREADEILRHHFNDDFHLYVTSYATCVDGSPWTPNAVAKIVGISVLAESDTIDWFVRDWVERGILEPAGNMGV